jgi:hypothetical protein
MMMTNFDVSPQKLRILKVPKVRRKIEKKNDKILPQKILCKKKFTLMFHQSRTTSEICFKFPRILGLEHFTNAKV